MRVSSNRYSEEFEPSKLWLNIGWTIENPETGEEEFIPLTKGVPLDSMEKLKIFNSQTEFAQKAKAINKVIDSLKAKGESMAEGEGEILPKLSVQLRRRKETVDDEGNEDMSGNFYYMNVI